MQLTPLPIKEKPIIIHGPGRSGTTLLSNMLSLHPDLGWLSSYVNRFPKWPMLSVLNRVQNSSAIERYSRSKRKWPRPAEAYNFWDHFFPGFSSNNTYEQHDERFEHNVKACQRAINQMLFYQGKTRFITKITGSSRHQVLEKVFQNPIIIYIDRDPRAVVMSYYKLMWRYKNKQALFDSKSFDELLSEYISMYCNNYQEKAQLSKFYFVQVFYEDLAKDPVAFIQYLTNEVGLSLDQSFTNFIKSWQVNRNTNEKWKANLSEQYQAKLTDQLKGPLKEMGYLR